MFVDHVNNARPEHHKLAGLEVKTSNLCSEITLPTGIDHHGKQRTAVCCLSSLNLETYLEWHEHPTFIEDVMRFLDNVLQGFIDNAGSDFARATYAAMRERSVGLGVMGFHSFLQANGIPLEIGDGQGVEQEDVQAHPRPVRRGLDDARQGARRVPGCRRLRLRGALLQQARDRADRVDLDHLRRRLARHRAVGGQRLQPQDPVGLLRGAQPVPREGARRRRARTTRTPGPSITDRPGLGAAISTASTTTRRRCSRPRSRSTSAGWSSMRADRTPFICQSQSLNIFLPADVHKRDLHQIHMMAWKRGVKSLYYCRSLVHPARRERRRRGARRAAGRPCTYRRPRLDAPSSVPPVRRPAPQSNRPTTKSVLAASNRSRPRRVSRVTRRRGGDFISQRSHSFAPTIGIRAMSLLDAKPIYKPFHYPWAYDAWLMQQRIHWLPEEVPLADDVKDWRNKLTDSERHLLTQIFRFFTQADVEVNNCYMRHYSRVFKPTEVQMMLAAFSAMETVHVAAYSHLLDTIGMPETEYSAFLHRQGDEGQVRLHAGASTSSRRPTSPRRWRCSAPSPRACSCSPRFAMLMNFPRFNKMKGMGQIVTWSVRDETLHCNSIIKLFRTFVQENPEIWTEELQREIYVACSTIVDHEDAFIDLAFETGRHRGHDRRRREALHPLHRRPPPDPAQPAAHLQRRTPRTRCRGWTRC